MPRPNHVPAPTTPVTIAAIEPHGLAKGLFWRVTYTAAGRVVGTGIVGAPTLAKARRSAERVAASIPPEAIPSALTPRAA